MEFEQRLPQTKKEGILFGLIISILSVNVIPPIITGFEAAFSLDIYLDSFHHMPLMWLAIFIFATLIQKPAGKLAHYFLGDNQNSFKATMLIEVLGDVFFMCTLMSIVGPWIGTQHISADPFLTYFKKWPRNFTVAFISEAFIIQPIARTIMSFIHTRKSVSVETVEPEDE